MKIMHIIGYFQPELGYEEFFLAKYQKKMGHQVVILTSDRYFPFPYYDIIYSKMLGDRKSPKTGYKTELGIPTIRIPVLLEFGSSIILKNFKMLINEFNPDIIHIHGIFYPITLQAIVLSGEHQIIIDEHMVPKFSSNIIGLIKKLYVLYFFSLLYKIILKFKIKGIYSTKHIVSDFIDSLLGVKTCILPLGVNTEHFSPFNIINNKELDIKLRNSDFTLFFSGKIVENKGLEDLILIFNRLNKKFEVFLLIVGSGPKNYILKLMKLVNNGLKKKIILFPFIDHEKLPNFMYYADIGCWLGNIPSASIPECLSMGKPVITKIFEGPDLEKMGYKFIKKYKSIEDAICYIENLIENPTLYNNRCNEARKYAKKYLDWYEISAQRIKFYKKALKKY